MQVLETYISMLKAALALEGLFTVAPPSDMEIIGQILKRAEGRLARAQKAQRISTPAGV